MLFKFVIKYLSCFKQLKYLETYRRGRNETDSKSVCPKGHEGSNPSVSAKKGPAFGKSFFYT